jgi:osmotically inducible lipoprotein OsmB
MKFRLPILLGAAAITLGACADPYTGQTNPQVRNAAIGAAGGAIAGNLIGGDTEATLAGAALGGVAGGIVGAEQQRRQMEAQRRNPTYYRY